MLLCNTIFSDWLVFSLIPLIVNLWKIFIFPLKPCFCGLNDKKKSLQTVGFFQYFYLIYLPIQVHFLSKFSALLPDRLGGNPNILNLFLGSFKSFSLFWINSFHLWVPPITFFHRFPHSISESLAEKNIAFSQE